MERFTERRYGYVMVDISPESNERYAAYEDINRTPDELAEDLAELEEYRSTHRTPQDIERLKLMAYECLEYRAKINNGRLVEVVRCGECVKSRPYYNGMIICTEKKLARGENYYCRSGERRNQE